MKTFKKPFYLILAFFFFIQSNAQNWNEVIKAVASDRAAEDYFGRSVSISGNYAIVGVSSEDEDVSGGNKMNEAGSAYIFERDGNNNWKQVQKIVAKDRTAEDMFGHSVSISGNLAIIGAPNNGEDASGLNYLRQAGSAYIFARHGNVWIQVKKIVASDRAATDIFGISVSISGTYIIVGAWGGNKDASGGDSLNDAGSAYIFEKHPVGVWYESNKIVASDRAANDRFGDKVSISGNYAIVGVSMDDKNASGGDSLTNAGSAYIFERIGILNWKQVQKIVAKDRTAGDHFGSSVSISGNYAIVGSSGEDEDISGGNKMNGAGSAYIFERNGSGNWKQMQNIVASDRANGDFFAGSVSINGNYAIVGASGEDNDTSGGDSIYSAGSAYIFERNGSGFWSQIQKIVASDRAIRDYFGNVSISRNYAIVGAPNEDEDPTGGNTRYQAGSVYIFKTCKNLNTSSILTISACNSYKSPSTNHIWTNNGTYKDTIPNVVGCDSVITINLTINKSTNSTINPTACISYISPSGNYTWTSSDTYSDTIQNAIGCDSVITVNLIINTVDTSVTHGGQTLTANALAATFQWLDCNNSYSPLVGATDQSFTPDNSGSYAVEVTQNGCVDTSNCVEVLKAGIITNSFPSNIIVYPNPTEEDFTIDLGSNYDRISLTVTDINGKIIKTKIYKQTQILNLSIDNEKGIYIIKIESQDKQAVIRLIKE